MKNIEKWKNQKMKTIKKEKKWNKMNKREMKKNKEIWLHTQDPRRFPWFCFGMCLFPEENQQPVVEGHRFSDEKCQFSLDVKQNTHFTDDGQRKQCQSLLR